MLPGDRLVCSFVEALDEDEQFTDWPLHVTIVPWFRLDMENSDLANELRATLNDMRPFQVTMGDETQLGRGKTVNLVRLPTAFTESEKSIRDLLKRHNAWLVDESTRRRHEYRPHVTAQKDERLYIGDVFVSDTFYLVEQRGSYKLITAKLKLAG